MNRSVWIVTDSSYDGKRIIGVAANRVAAVRLATDDQRRRNHRVPSWTSDPDTDNHYISDDLRSPLYAESDDGFISVREYEVVK